MQYLDELGLGGMQDTQHSLHIWPFDLIQEVVEA